jgi:hypothetical protein
MIMCAPCMSNYYLYEFFIEIIDNKKIEKNNEIDDNVYIMYVKKIYCTHYQDIDLFYVKLLNNIIFTFAKW